MNEDQQTPIANTLPIIQDLVIVDLIERKEVGKQRYGTYLQPFNGRNSLIDAYQEVLDLCQYIRQKIEEQRLLKEYINDQQQSLPKTISREEVSIILAEIWSRI